MRIFRTLAGLLILLCLLPPMVLLAATLIARSVGCEINPDAPSTCRIIGWDFGDFLYAMTHFGWYAVETLPILAALLASWMLIEIVRSIGRPRKHAAPQTPASSRNRERGS
ncbi:MAG: hypothetical protein WCD20_06450 [Rhodomicrobium sp.]